MIVIMVVCACSTGCAGLMGESIFVGDDEGRFYCLLIALAGGGILYILEWQDVLYRATMQ